MTPGRVRRSILTRNGDFRYRFAETAPADGLGSPLKAEPTSVEGLAREGTADVYGYKDDSGGCDVKTRIDARNDVNPFVPERLYRHKRHK